VILAIVQYRWIGEIGQAEAERHRAQIERSSRHFATSLDREVARVYLAFRPEPGPPPNERAATFLDRLAALRQGSEHGGLASSLALVSRERAETPTYETCDLASARCSPAPWPRSLDPLREWIEEAGMERAPREPFPGLLSTLVDDPPALLLPTFASPDRAAPARMGRFRPGDRVNGFLVVGLDVGYLREHVWPQIAEASFGPLDEGEYVVAVLRRRDNAVLYTSDPSFGSRDMRSPDVRLDLFGPPWRAAGWERRLPARPDLAGEGPPRGWAATGEGPPPGAWAAPRELARPVGAASPWVLVARHRGGSLAEAVASVRRRNLVVGLGILGLLGGAAVLLTTGAQRARRLAQQQLEFVAGVTHELHTPLAAIRSAGQNLADGIVTEPERIRRYGDLIQKESGRLTALVAQVLEFAGIETGSRAYQLEPVALDSLVNEVAGDLALVLDQAGMRLDTDVPDDLPAVRADGPALRRVLENLITNAVKFASEGGWVGVRAAPARHGAGVVLRIEDRGPGIADDEQTRVFEPFYRGRAAQERQIPGSGLGLSVARHVVEAHGGRLHVEAREGGGTAVVLELAS
jgi:signal transduction histidine kinase